MKQLKRAISYNLNNYRGWKTDRKIVVIESDDWGSICMPSTETYRALIEKGYRVDLCPYASNDCLASEKDLDELFSVITKFKDHRGNHPVITANSVVANPNFDKIKGSGFSEYFYEPFTETLSRYPESSHGNSFQIWNEGISQKLFFPQFHGREHIYVKLWLFLLKDDTSVYKSVYDEGVSWLGSTYAGENVSLRAAFEAEQLSDLEIHSKIIKQGLDLFERMFGYRSKSFIAPNYVYHPKLNTVLYDEGIQTIQGMKYQYLPKLDSKSHQRKRHVQGEKNDLGQVYLVRNCTFEPSQFPAGNDNVAECMMAIKNAFFWKKPAIISAHRLNFIGHIHPENRERTLVQFRELLSKIIKRWPEVEFMTSVELGEFIRS